MRGLLILSLFLAAALCSAEKLPMCGYHGKPLAGPAEEPASLTAEKFWSEYVRKAEPVIIRGAVAKDRGVTVWNDDYILKNYGHMKVRMEAKDEGGDRKEDMPSVDSMKNFYSKWLQHGYTVTQVPGGMNNESSIPACMSCGPIRDQLVEANLWISTGDTNSKIHKDSNNQMNCLYQGIKDWTLFAPEHSKSMYLINERPGLDQMFDTAGMSRIATRGVDLKRFPKFGQVPFMKVRVQPGDCLYVPGTYLHHVYSSGHRNIQVSLLFAGPDVPTAMQRVHGKKVGGPTFAAAEDFGAKCGPQGTADGNLAIGHVDMAWPFDGVGPITMGFSNPHAYIKEWKDGLEKVAKGGSVDKKTFIKVFLDFYKTLDPCNDKTARFSDDPEMKRHVFEAMDVLKPEVSGKHEHWNATCKNNNCMIPKLCTIISDATKAQASALFDKISKDGKLDPAVFNKLSRRTVQDAIVAPFVRDQVSAVFEEVQGDYEGASGTQANFENRDDSDGSDEKGEDDDEEEDDEKEDEL